MLEDYIPTTYRVYYEDATADPNDPPFTEVLAINEDDALSKATSHDNKSWTHAEYYG